MEFQKFYLYTFYNLPHINVILSDIEFLKKILLNWFQFVQPPKNIPDCTC